MTHEEHVRALRDLLRTDHEEWIAEVQGWADAAAAAGDVLGQRQDQAYADRLRAMTYPWERTRAA